MPYTVLSHTADTGIEATADTFPALLRELATGMFELMASPPPGAVEKAIAVDVASTGNEELVVEFLSELLYQSEVEDLFFFRFEVQETGPGQIRISAGGVSNVAIDLSGPPIKAVTYYDVAVQETEAGWYGRVYFDV